MIDVESTIVGAGPYGLSVAAYMRESGMTCRVLGTPLETWRSFMPPGMMLKSDYFASSLWDPFHKHTIKRFSKEESIPYKPYGTVLSREDFVRYADWFRGRAVGDVTDVKVDRIDKTGSHYTLDLADGSRLTSRYVVLATGYMGFRTIPPELANIPEPLGFHSMRLHDLSGFKGRDVTLVGAGQSALETAALLHEAGAHPRVVVRKDAVRWNPPPHSYERPLFEKITQPKAGLGAGYYEIAVGELPRVFRLFAYEKRHRFVAQGWGPSGAAWLRPRLEGKVEMLTSHRVRSATVEGERVRLSVEGPNGPKDLLTDHVIAATGVKVDLDRMTILSPALRASLAREAQAPKLDPWFETSSPGLFMVGVASAPTFGPVMRFMFGAKHAAPIVTRRLKWRRRFSS